MVAKIYEPTDDLIKLQIFTMYQDGKIREEEYNKCEKRWRNK